MAILTPQKLLGRPRKHRKVAEFQKVDVRELFRAHPNLHGLRNVSLTYAGEGIVVQIKYHNCVVARPQPVFVCSQCEKGARVLFGVSRVAGVQLGGREPHLAGSAALVCRTCAKADPDSHNLTGEQRSLRRTARLRTLLKGGGRSQKVKGQHWITHAQLSRGLMREAQVREELGGLRADGVSRFDAERLAAKATGTVNPTELTDAELRRALRAFRRASAILGRTGKR